MTWEVFAVIYTNTSFSYIDAEPEGGAQALAQAAMEKSIYDYGVTVGRQSSSRKGRTPGTRRCAGR